MNDCWGYRRVLDWVIQQAIGQVLTPIFDPAFFESSFGFRLGAPPMEQSGRYSGLSARAIRIAVDLDLEKFFDKVNHEVLMARMARKVRDKCLLGLIGRYLRAGVLVGDLIQATELGTPQGSPLPPLLANILLDDLDKELERRGHRFVRYADDLRILVRSQRAGGRVETSVTRYLAFELKLTVNEQKSRVVKTNDCEFLEFTFRGTKLRWTETFADFKHTVRKLTGRNGSSLCPQ